MGRDPRLGWAALLVSAALLGAGCTGSRTGGIETGNGAPTTPTTASGASQAGTTSFGDLASPCGPGDAKGGTEQGVTDASITIGYGDDAGYPAAPGLSHETSDAIKAFVNWCNAQGGINGRRIVGKYYDAKVTEVANAISDACKQVFMLVGEAWSFDAGQEQTRLACKLPAVPAFSVSAEFANAPEMFQGVPNPIDYSPDAIAAQIAKAFPDKITKTAVMFGNYSATIDTNDKVVATYPAFGFRFLDCPQEYNILGEADYKPLVQKLKSCGAQVVYFSGTAAPNFEDILNAAAQLDYKPIWLSDTNIYVEAFAKWNTSGAGNQVYVRDAFTPLEEASHNKATQQYIEIVRADGGDTAVLGEQATSSFLLWATAAKACGSNLTRACVVDELSKVHKWTGGGLHAETDPAANMPPQCGMLLKLDDAKWVRFDPKGAASFACSPDYVVKVTGRVVDQAQLGPDRRSTKFGT
jgi:ABC-type branched-subunit amino acid transport system substrate-binding protein